MKRNRGITMVELVVGMGILGIVGLMVAALLASSLRMYRSGITYADLQTECQMASRRLNDVLMNAANIYYDETEEGSYLFTGTIIDGGGKSIYSGPVIWFNKKTNCLYQNDNVSIESTEEADNNGGSAPPGSKTIAASSTRPLTAELVKTALEGGRQTDSREYLISDRIQEIGLAISPPPGQIDALFSAVDRIPTFRYSITAGDGEEDEYTMTSSVTPRNRIGRLHFAGGGEIGTEEESK